MENKLKKQNILFFTRSLGLGGTERVILQLCEIFNPLVNKIVVCSSGGVNVRKLEELGIKHYTIPDIQKKNPFVILKTINVLKEIIKNENITIIHTHHRMAAFYISFLRLYKKCKFFVTAHFIFDDKKKLTKFSYRHARVVACGESVKKSLLEFYDLDERKVLTISNSIPKIDIKHLSSSTSYKFSDNPTVAYIGRLNKIKGIYYYLYAAKEILSNHKNISFIIVGDGEEYNGVKQFILDNKLDDKIKLLGYQENIQKIIAKVDIVVLPSFQEGMPLLPIECFSVGKTIIATDIPATADVVKDDYNGILIKTKSVSNIVDKVILLLENKEYRDKLENNAMLSYNNSFSYDIFKKKYIEFYLNHI